MAEISPLYNCTDKSLETLLVCHFKLNWLSALHKIFLPVPLEKGSMEMLQTIGPIEKTHECFCLIIFAKSVQQTFPLCLLISARLISGSRVKTRCNLLLQYRSWMRSMESHGSVLGMQHLRPFSRPTEIESAFQSGPKLLVHWSFKKHRTNHPRQVR